MKWYSYIVLLLVVGLTTISCVDDRDVGSGNNSGNGGEITQTFTLQLPASVQAASTYAMQMEDENRIATLDVLVFKEELGVETYAYTAQATSIEDVNGNSQKKTVKLKLDADGQRYRFVFLANVRDELKAQLPDIAAVGEKEEVLKRLTHTIAADKRWNAGDYFPMWGESQVWPIVDENSIQETIKMLRAVSRIDVTVMDTISNFTLRSAYIYQYNRKGQVVPKPGYVGTDKKVTAPTLPSDPLVVDKSVEFSATNGVLVQEMYVYESEKNDQHLEKTCVVVGGIYKPEGYQGDGADLQPTYYRIDFVDTNKKDIALLRNYWYTLKITAVKGEGYEDEDKAYKEKPFNVDVDILEWNQGDITDIVFGQYLLGVSRSEIHMPSPEDTTSIIVTTDYPFNKGGWTADFSSTPWLHHESGVCTGELIKDRLVFRLDENTAKSQRVGYIHLKAGVLKHTITVYQYPPDEEDGPPDDVKWVTDVGDSNCYILSPTGDGIKIPVSQANKDGQSRIGENDILEAEILWTDTPYAVGDDKCVIRYVGVSGKGKDGFVEVAANGVKGNALVAVKVNGIIRWSWHIWVLDYSPSETLGSYHYIGSSNNKTFDMYWMDRNVGALTNEEGNNKTIGLVYQWGRKDPFPGLAGFSADKGFNIYDKNGIETFIKIGNNGNLEKSIENPMTFYTGGSDGDWMTPPNDHLWSIDNNTIYYDPCPDGWTINQPIEVWQELAWDLGFSFNGNKYGAISSKIGYWPATAAINTSGTFDTSKAGAEGYYWMGESNGLRAYNLKIHNSWSCIEVGGNFGRSQALSVRCIKD